MTHAPMVPVISVIVPVYNVADFIAPCMASLQRQTFRDFEVIVIVDGATDDSAARARDIIGADQRFSIIEQDNMGLSGARNVGLDRALGEFIAFVDSDDRVLPNYLQALHDALIENAADWVSCGVRYCDVNGGVVLHSSIHDAPDLAEHRVPRRYRFQSWRDVIRHFPSAWNKLYRRDLIADTRFDEGVWFEDHGFFQTLAAKTDHIVHILDALYLQTQGRAGQITGQDDDRIFQIFDVLDTLKGRLDNTHTDGNIAFEQIVTQLIYERSTTLRSVERRARFAQASADFLARHGISYRPETGLDDNAARSWQLEMEDILPLSIVITWDGRAPAVLETSLTALARMHGPGHEVVIVCPSEQAISKAKTLAGDHGRMKLIKHNDIDPAHARAAALSQTDGYFVTFLAAGDAPHPWVYLRWTEALLTSGAPMGVSHFQIGAGADAIEHTGFQTKAFAPPPLDAHSTFDVTPANALALEPHLSAKTFTRRFLTSIQFDDTGLTDAALTLVAASKAERIAYIGFNGVTLSTQADAQTRTQNRASGFDLGRRHRATIDQITTYSDTQFQDQLPLGWQRRLFARGFNQRLRIGANTTWAQLWLVLTTALMSWRLGYNREGVASLPLDPSIGPKQALALNPRHLWFLAYHRLRGRTVRLPQINQRPKNHWAFPLSDHGHLRFRTDFSQDDFANLTFHAANIAVLPFHVSLRFTQGCLVWNDTALNGDWHRERKVPFNLARVGDEVCVTFTKRRVEVQINDEPILTLPVNSLFARGGLRKTGAIRSFSLQGGVRPTQIVPHTPQDDRLILDSRLQVRAVGLAFNDNVEMTVEHGQLAPQSIPVVMSDDRTSVSAMIPGRVWQGAGPDDALTLTLHCGAQTRTLVITRDTMATRIADLLDGPLCQVDAALIAVLTEQLLFADVMAMLAPHHQARARQLARSVGQTLDAVAPTPTFLPVPPKDPLITQFQSALAQFTRSQNSAPAPDPIAMLRDLSLEPAPRRILFLTLAEFFCQADRDVAGFVALAQELDVQVFNGESEDDIWTCSAMLPFLFQSGQIESLITVLEHIADKAGTGWVLTSPLAWTLRRALASNDLPPPQVDAILTAFMIFVQRESASYWGRAACTELTMAAAALAVSTDKIPDTLKPKIGPFCLRTYGLSKSFWADVDQANTGSPLPSPLEDARTYAHTLFAASPPLTPQARTALSYFADHGTAAAEQIARDLSGPEYVDLQGPLTPPLADAWPDAAWDSAIIRRMALPDGPDQPEPDRAARDIRALSGVACAPDIDLQTKVGTELHALWAEPDRAIDAALLDDLATLATPENHYLGVGLAMSLLQRENTSQMSHWINDHISTVAAPDRAALFKAPAVRMAITGLRNSETPLPASVAHIQTDATQPLGSIGKAAPHLDTLVVVFSCVANLNTRIPALRSAWLDTLKVQGVPYIVIVGGGDGQHKGDIVHLDAPDDYEGLPQKTLAAISWVHRNTSFSYMVKVDDDCILNPPLFFRTLSYRKFDYYGRTLIRDAGQMDRSWHQEKSGSPRGWLELDKSSEPSSYADGGSGYVLSRDAMGAAMDAAQSPEGQAIVQSSFMEDKMLGDLLITKGIAVQDDDYLVSIRRRSHKTAPPVPHWHNSFFPTQAAPVDLVHLDTHLDQELVAAGFNDTGLHPRKIWPSYQPVRIGAQSNALELLSPEDCVARAKAADVAVVACMRNEMFMLPHFLAHYRALGVGAFLIADNLSDDGSLEYLLEQPDVALFSVDTDYSRSHYGVAWQQALLAAFRQNKWSLVADADELLVWEQEQTQTLSELLSDAAFDDADAARIFMLDMYPKGSLSDATFKDASPFEQAGFVDRVPFLTDSPMRGPFSDQPSWTSALRHRLIPRSNPNLFVAQKLALLRYQPWMRLSDGLHYVTGATLASRELLFAHFKYNAAFREKARIEVERGQHFNDGEEYRKYLALMSEGRDVIYDAQMSAPWHDSPFVRHILETGHAPK
ncbi:MAG: glycosyltransferase [Yoonia sp.]|uniref:glycosyltransferase n=1 Tax=Yoonia sp. TaxID=2212373 RepID=UPI003EF629F5